MTVSSNNFTSLSLTNTNFHKTDQKIFERHFMWESGRFGIFERVMASKIIHFYIFFISYGQHKFLKCFPNSDDLFPSYEQLQFERIFSGNWLLAGSATFVQITFRKQHKHIIFLPKYWFITEIHYKKLKISVYVHTLASHFNHSLKNVFKIDPNLTVTI